MYLLSSSGSDSTGASTMAFSLLALSPLVHAWSCRSPSTSIIRQRPLVSWPLVVAVAASASLQLFAVFIPALRPIFHTDTLPRRDWLLVLVGTVAVLPAVEVAKAVSRWLASGSHERNRRPGRRSCPDGESRF
jgi:Ca2+-transporting ATPase